MKIILFSDIHSNLPALEAFFHDADKHNADAMYCLGDLVGYNTWPNEVVQEIRKRKIPTGRPMAKPKNPEIKVIRTVSSIPFKIRLLSESYITYNFYNNMFINKIVNRLLTAFRISTKLHKQHTKTGIAGLVHLCSNNFRVYIKKPCSLG